jgi:hypothetical protein
VCVAVPDYSDFAVFAIAPPLVSAPYAFVWVRNLPEDATCDNVCQLFPEADDVKRFVEVGATDKRAVSYRMRIASPHVTRVLEQSGTVGHFFLSLACGRVQF